jgi:hypothetical protein
MKKEKNKENLEIKIIINENEILEENKTKEKKKEENNTIMNEEKNILNEKLSEIIKNEDIKTIFQNIEEILKIHDLFLKSIKVIIHEEKEKIIETQDFYETFFELIKTFEKIYIKYFIGYDESIQRLKKMKENKYFDMFCRNNKRVKLRSGESVGLSIESLLINPIQRLPRYEILLNQLLRFTPKFHFNHLNVKNLILEIEKFNILIDNEKGFFYS